MSMLSKDERLSLEPAPKAKKAKGSAPAKEGGKGSNGAKKKRSEGAHV